MSLTLSRTQQTPNNITNFLARDGVCWLVYPDASCRLLSDVAIPEEQRRTTRHSRRVSCLLVTWIGRNVLLIGSFGDRCCPWSKAQPERTRKLLRIFTEEKRGVSVRYLPISGLKLWLVNTEIACLDITFSRKCVPIEELPTHLKVVTGIIYWFFCFITNLPLQVCMSSGLSFWKGWIGLLNAEGRSLSYWLSSSSLIRSAISAPQNALRKFTIILIELLRTRMVFSVPRSLLE